MRTNKRRHILQVLRGCGAVAAGILPPGRRKGEGRRENVGQIPPIDHIYLTITSPKERIPDDS